MPTDQTNSNILELNPNKILFNQVLAGLRVNFFDKGKWNDEDIKLINIFKEAIQAKTFKYFTKERRDRLNAFDFLGYITRECSETKTTSQRLQFSVIHQKLGNFKNNPVMVTIYQRLQNQGDDYY